jgi:hypothetical protein
VVTFQVSPAELYRVLEKWRIITGIGRKPQQNENVKGRIL